MELCLKFGKRIVESIRLQLTFRYFFDIFWDRQKLDLSQNTMAVIIKKPGLSEYFWRKNCVPT